MQILPAIDLRNGRCVRLQQGDYARETVFSDDPVQTARRWVAEGAERLHLVDLDGARDGQPAHHDVVGRIVAAAGVPCQLGGGIRDEQAVRDMLDDVGLDRVIIGTQALQQPDWFREMVERFPGRIALGLDARESHVATDGWLNVSTISAIELARGFSDIPLAAVIYTNIANDGMMSGIDKGTLSDLVALAELGFPVIASGGVTTLGDVRNLAETAQHHPNLVGAIIGRALYEGNLTVGEAVSIAAGNG